MGSNSMRETSDVKEYMYSAIEESILIHKDIIVYMYKGFERLLKFVGGLLYNSAKEAGRLMLKKMKEKDIVNDDNVLSALLESFVLAGYAEQITVKDVRLEKGKTIIEIEGKGLLLGSKLKSKRPVDQPLAGYMAGWLEEYYGAKTQAREIACTARGDKACIILIEIKKPVPKIKEQLSKVFRRKELLKSAVT